MGSKRYTEEIKEEIKQTIIGLYGQQGYTNVKMAEYLTASGYTAPNGKNPVAKGTVGTIVAKLKKDGVLPKKKKARKKSGTKIEELAETDDYAEIEIDLHVDCPQLILDCLVSEDLLDAQKIGMIRGYYGC